MAVSSVSNPNLEMVFAERRKLLASKLCELVDADVWLWFSGVYNTQENGDSMVTSFVDGGFINESERAEFFRVVINPDLVAIVNSPISQSLAANQSIVCSRTQLISDARWREIAVSSLWHKLGFNDFIISAHPIGSSNYSAVGLHRRVDKPPFTDREIAMVRLVTTAVNWLHNEPAPVEASSQVLSLSPRERHVVTYLIQGDSRKEVARKLGLSEHTISDYLKEIYRKFGVRTRAELLSKFIQS